MNGRKSKALRRMIFGDNSKHEKQKYAWNTKTGSIIRDPNSQRGRYQQLKKAVKNGTCAIRIK